VKEWKPSGEGDFFECTLKEQEAALLHRFAAAGAAVRYQALNQKTTEEVLALRHCTTRQRPKLDRIHPSPKFKAQLDLSLDYGHFMCHVFHRDYIFKKGTDLQAMKAKLP
jgi:D-lactate dehydrogenase